MKSISITSILIVFLSVLFSCSNDTSQPSNIGKTKPISITHFQSTQDTVTRRDTIQKPTDPNVALLSKLEKIPPFKDFRVIGKVRLDTLKYESADFGDMLHLIFVDRNGKTYDFNSITTKDELYDDFVDPEYGTAQVEANKKFVNKTFVVGWRHLKLKSKVKVDSDFYYAEHDQIIYLQRIN